MEQEKIIKGYDPVIMRRLLQFTKPYKLPAIIAILALLVATVAELATPVIMQRAIDEHIMARYYRFSSSTNVRQTLEEHGLFADARSIGDHYYLPETDSEKVPAD